MTRRALAAVALAAACACSGKTETGDESACEKIVQQICAKWIQEGRREVLGAGSVDRVSIAVGGSLTVVAYARYASS